MHSMTAANLPECVRGLLAETGVEAHPYRLVGAGFLVAFRQFGFFVTAKHVINTQSADTELVFPIGPTDMIVLRRQGLLDGQDSFQDLAFYPYPATRFDQVAPEWRDIALPLTPSLVQTGRKHFQSGAEMCAVGIPQDTRSIDYDSGRIQLTTVAVSGVYESPDPDRRWVHRGKFSETAGLTSYHGLSGSPVFTTVPPFVGLAGCLIEAGEASGPFHFIDSLVLWNAASIACRDLEPGPA
jgi:hypothetical protein